MSFAFHSDSTEIEIRGERADTIEGNKMRNMLLQIWLGPKPVDEKLRQTLLGRPIAIHR
jgi:hypothetical protein